VPPDTSAVYVYVEQMPRLPLVTPATTIAQRLQQLVRLPPEVRTGAVSGDVVVSFLVLPDGYVHDVRVERGLSPACDAAAKRAVASLPRLIPGYQSKRAVKVSLQVPLHFAAPASKQPSK
jgi:TonB family protein